MYEGMCVYGNAASKGVDGGVGVVTYTDKLNKVLYWCCCFSHWCLWMIAKDCVLCCAAVCAVLPGVP